MTPPLSPAALRARLLALDAMALVASYLGVRALRLQTSDLFALRTLLELGGFALVNVLALYLFDLYSQSPHAPQWIKPVEAWVSAFLSGCFIVVASYALGAIEFRDSIGRGVLIGSEFAFALCSSLVRFRVGRRGRRQAVRARWLVLGTEESLADFLGDVARSGTSGTFTLVGPEDSLSVPVSRYVTVVHAGSCDALKELARESWSGVIVATGAPLSDEAWEVLLAMRSQGVNVLGLPDFYEQAWHKVPASQVERRWFAVARGFDLLGSPFRLRLKRVFDVAGALLLLALSSPALIVAAILIKLESPGPVLYKQTRVGENGRHFTIWKLRSMRNDAEKNGAQWSSSNDARVTRVGAFIRRTRIDELPQLCNVLSGAMSFVGPRPERPEFTSMLEREIPLYALRHTIKPGLTGWAQVMYPYGSSVDDAREKLQYDLYYVKNHSMVLDVAIVLRTVRVVLMGVTSHADLSAAKRVVLSPLDHVPADVLITHS